MCHGSLCISLPWWVVLNPQVDAIEAMLKVDHPKVWKSLFGEGAPPKSAWLDSYREVDNHGVMNQNWAEVFNYLIVPARTQYHLGASAFATLHLIESRLAKMAASSPYIEKYMSGAALTPKVELELMTLKNRVADHGFTVISYAEAMKTGTISSGDSPNFQYVQPLARPEPGTHTVSTLLGVQQASVSPVRVVDTSHIPSWRSACSCGACGLRMVWCTCYYAALKGNDDAQAASDMTSHYNIQPFLKRWLTSSAIGAITVAAREAVKLPKLTVHLVQATFDTLTGQDFSVWQQSILQIRTSKVKGPHTGGGDPRIHSGREIHQDGARSAYQAAQHDVFPSVPGGEEVARQPCQWCLKKTHRSHACPLRKADHATLFQPFQPATSSNQPPTPTRREGTGSSSHTPSDSGQSLQRMMERQNRVVEKGADERLRKSPMDAAAVSGKAPVPAPTPAPGQTPVSDTGMRLLAGVMFTPRHGRSVDVLAMMQDSTAASPVASPNGVVDLSVPHAGGAPGASRDEVFAMAQAVAGNQPHGRSTSGSLAASASGGSPSDLGSDAALGSDSGIGTAFENGDVVAVHFHFPREWISEQSRPEAKPGAGGVSPYIVSVPCAPHLTTASLWDSRSVWLPREAREEALRVLTQEEALRGETSVTLLDFLSDATRIHFTKSLGEDLPTDEPISSLMDEQELDVCVVATEVGKTW